MKKLQAGHSNLSGSIKTEAESSIAAAGRQGSGDADTRLMLATIEEHVREGIPAAVEPLKQKLANLESDLRPSVEEALGTTRSMRQSVERAQEASAAASKELGDLR